MPIPPRLHNIGTGCGTRTHTPSQAPRFERDTAANYVNPALVDRVGVEPTVSLTSQIYSLLPSPLGTPIHIVYINHLQWLVSFGDACGGRTRDPGMKTRCLNRLTNAPFGSPSRTRTCDQMINSHLFYQLNYRRIRINGEPSEARTRDLRIKSPLLYQLSYRFIWARPRRRDRAGKKTHL